MADVLKILAQSNPSATTDTTIYTVPAVTSVVITFLSVCNLSASAATFRIWVGISGAGTSNQQYIYYDFPLAGNDTFRDSSRIALATTDVVKVRSSTANLAFTISGMEIT